ncbi:MAG: hypothetical protein R2823_04165 [Acidimicrobiia bacterium]
MVIWFVIAGIVAFVAWAIALSRRQSERKKQAIASLQEEQEQLTPFDIHALVDAEVADLGLRAIEGSDGIPSPILLKVWNTSADVVKRCPSRDLLRFVVASGVAAAEAADTDVTLVCDDTVTNE